MNVEIIAGISIAGLAAILFYYFYILKPKQPSGLETNIGQMETNAASILPNQANIIN